MSLISSFKDGWSTAEEASKLEAEAKRIREEVIPKIKVSTSSICKKFEVIECVWGFDVSEDKDVWFSSVSASQGKAFTKVLRDLQEKCFDLRGDAVINCQFDYRYLTNEKGKQRVEVYAYGTVVSFID
jgi:hypothetical protein